MERSSSRGAGSFGSKKFNKIEGFSHSGRVGKNRGNECVGPCECLCFALEVNLPVLVEAVVVSGDASIEDRIELIAISAREIQTNELVNLGRIVDLIPVQRGLEIVKPVWIGFVAQDRCSIELVERCADRLGIVHEIQNEGVVLLGVCAVETRQGLNRFDARQGLVHIHGMQKRLVVPGLKFVGADQESIRIGFDLIDDILRGKPVEAGLGDFHSAEFMLARKGDDRTIRALAFDQIGAHRLIVLDRAFDS